MILLRKKKGGSSWSVSTTDSSKNTFILWQSIVLSEFHSLQKDLCWTAGVLFSFCLSWYRCILFAKKVQLLLSFYNILFPFIFFQPFLFPFHFFSICILKIDRSASVASRLDEQKQFSVFHWKTDFIWQLWDINDSRLKTLGPCALFIPLRANMCIITKANVQQAIM